MKIPSDKECDELMQKYMLPNIIEHSIQVMNIAMEITENLKDEITINKKLTKAGALLHDLTKTRSLKTGEAHDITGAELLRDLDFPDVADIVEEHVILKTFHADKTLNEKEIVFYADKRVMHTKVVTVKKRVEDLIERYAKTTEIKNIIIKNRDLIYKVEKKINLSMKKSINAVIKP